MKKRILSYMENIDKALQQKDATCNYGELLEEHKIQLGFFMHERLIHLLVTIAFALLTFGAFFMLCIEFSIGLLALFILIFIPMAPYISHYYLLENGVQKMYKQYDELLRVSKQENKKGTNKL